MVSFSSENSSSSSSHSAREYAFWFYPVPVIKILIMFDCLFQEIKSFYSSREHLKRVITLLAVVSKQAKWKIYTGHILHTLRLLIFVLVLVHFRSIHFSSHSVLVRKIISDPVSVRGVVSGTTGRFGQKNVKNRFERYCQKTNKNKKKICI